MPSDDRLPPPPAIVGLIVATTIDRRNHGHGVEHTLATMSWNVSHTRTYTIAVEATRDLVVAGRHRCRPPSTARPAELPGVQWDREPDDLEDFLGGGRRNAGNVRVILRARMCSTIITPPPTTTTTTIIMMEK